MPKYLMSLWPCAPPTERPARLETTPRVALDLRVFDLPGTMVIVCPIVHPDVHALRPQAATCCCASPWHASMVRVGVSAWSECLKLTRSIGARLAAATAN